MSPRKPSGKPPREPFMVRLNEEERRLFEQAAHAEGLGIAAWVRSTCIKAARAAEKRR